MKTKSLLVALLVYSLVLTPLPPVSLHALPAPSASVAAPPWPRAFDRTGSRAAWGKRLAADYTSDPHATYYQLAELQSAPSLVRGMILHGMRTRRTAAAHPLRAAFRS